MTNINPKPPAYLDSMLDVQTRSARRVPPKEEMPFFEWQSAKLGDQTTTKVTIHRNGVLHLSWTTTLTCEDLIASEADRLIERMKQQFMGKPRAAEAYI